MSALRVPSGCAIFPQESIEICCEAMSRILEQAGQCGVPLGLSVESVSGFREEIDGCFELFRRLQSLMLDSKGALPVPSVACE